MSIFLLILKAVLVYFILMYISVNLIGLIIRSFFIRGGEIDRYSNDVKIITELHHSKKSLIFGFVIFVIASYLLYLITIKFHWGYSLSALIIMILRVPDLLWEIKKNRKITKEYGPKTTFLNTTINIFLNFISFILVIYALYQN
jgi:hypothetical protein